MAGGLVLAAGVPAAFDRHDFVLVTLGDTTTLVVSLSNAHLSPSQWPFP